MKHRLPRRHRRRRRLAGLVPALLSATLLAACGPAATQQQFDTPACGVASAALLLMAQAVPTASQVPCIRTLPVGWSFRSIDVRNGSARFWLDSDRAGLGALEVLLTASCRPSGTPTPSDQLGSSLYVKIRTVRGRFKGDLIYLLPSGCITYRVDFPAKEKAVLRTDAITAIGQMPRLRLERYVRTLGYTL